MLFRLLIDIDDCIADFTKFYLECADNVLGQRCSWGRYQTNSFSNIWNLDKKLEYTKEELDKVWSVINSRDPMELTILPGAGEAVHWFKDRCEVYFATSPLYTNPRWCDTRFKWMEYHLGGWTKNKIIFIKNKEFLKADFLLDDNPENTEKYKKVWPNAEVKTFKRKTSEACWSETGLYVSDLITEKKGH